MQRNFYYSIEYCGEDNASFSILPQVIPFPILKFLFISEMFASLYLCVRKENSNFKIKIK